MMLDAPKRLVGVDVADDDEGGVVRNVVAAVVPVEIVAAHRFQIGDPSDRRMPVRVRLERGRGQLLVEQLVGIVFAALELGDDHRPLRLAIVGMVEAVGHALGLDEQHAIERVSRGGFEIRRLVDEGVAIPAAAELLDDALHLIARNVGRPLEVHVLDPVGDAGEAGLLVLRSDLVPAPHRRERRRVLFLDDHFQPVIELAFSRLAGPSPGRRVLPEWPSVHYRIVGYPCLSGKTPSTCRAPTSR